MRKLAKEKKEKERRHQDRMEKIGSALFKEVEYA
jgi:hypothetical protein